MEPLIQRTKEKSMRKRRKKKQTLPLNQSEMWRKRFGNH